MSQPDFDIAQLLPTGALLQGGKYRVERYLSSGNFGNTYIVTHQGMQRQFAMKEFFLRNICYRTGGAAVSVSPAVTPERVALQREKFKKEAQRLSALAGPHVVHVHDLFEENNTVYYVMDFVKGESLARYMERTGQPLTEEQVRYILDQLLDGLAEIHARKIWHLDLKPDNVMIDSSGNVVIIDFGASKQLGQSGRYTGTSNILCYTPGYAPAEQVSQNLEAIGPWTDIYALGATLYSLLTAIDPSTQQGRNLQYPANVSRRMQQLIARMMNPTISERPQSVDEVRKLLDKKPAAQPKNQQAQPERPKRWWGRRAVMGGCAALVLAGGLMVLLPGGQHSAWSQYEQVAKEKHLSPLPHAIESLIENMVYVESGKFTMGAGAVHHDGVTGDNEPAHTVALSAFYIGRYEVTQEQWQAVMHTNPSKFKGDHRPVETIDRDDCQRFIRQLNNLTGMHFRLPTEAEWEYAAQGGRRGKQGKDLTENEAWYNMNSADCTHDVGQKHSNELGVYDMLGNVMEMCSDWYNKTYYATSPKENPTGPAAGGSINKVCRGGSWGSSAQYCQTAYRDCRRPNFKGSTLGFRLVLEP